MAQQLGFTVRHSSVVLVSPSPVDPQSIRPEILSNARIVPDSWVSANNINTPVLAVTQYQNGVTVQTEGNRCVFQEQIGGDWRDTYEVHPLAKRYAEATSLVPYNALGINWLLDIVVGNPAQWIREKTMGNGDSFPGFSPMSLQMVKRLSFAVCNLTFRAENTRIVVDCNYHVQTESRPLDMILSTLDSWQRYQDHLKREVVPQL